MELLNLWFSVKRFVILFVISSLLIWTNYCLLNRLYYYRSPIWYPFFLFVQCVKEATGETWQSKRGNWKLKSHLVSYFNTNINLPLKFSTLQNRTIIVGGLKVFLSKLLWMLKEKNLSYWYDWLKLCIQYYFTGIMVTRYGMEYLLVSIIFSTQGLSIELRRNKK